VTGEHLAAFTIGLCVGLLLEAFLSRTKKRPTIIDHRDPVIRRWPDQREREHDHR